MVKSLGRSQGSISRELARNTGQRGYRNKQAESFAQERHKNKPKKCVSIIVLAAFYAFALYWLGTFFNGVYSDFMRIEEKTSHFTRFFSAKSIFFMLSMLLIYLDDIPKLFLLPV
jgi:hypothetical protein